MLRRGYSMGWAVPAVAAALVATSLGGAIGRAAEPKQERRKADRASPARPIGKKAIESAIRNALAAPTTIEFTKEPLQNLVAYLKDYHKIEIQLDTKSLEQVGVAPDDKITANVKGVSLRSALDLVLRPLGLTFTIHDEVLFITTPDAVPEMLTVEVYDVADLVACRDEKGQPWDDYETLVHMITSQIDLASWSEVGGPGAVSAATLGQAKVLVVTQHTEIHRKVADLLERIRSIGAKSAGDGKPPTRPRPRPGPASDEDQPENDKKAAKSEF